MSKVWKVKKHTFNRVYPLYTQDVNGNLHPIEEGHPDHTPVAIGGHVPRKPGSPMKDMGSCNKNVRRGSAMSSSPWWKF